MASVSTPFRNSFLFSTIFLLLLLLQFFQCSIATAPLSFCPLTLSRPTCPDLPTYDAFDITTYGGRWFEIGASANFKNLQESGGICVEANYTLLQAPSPGIGAVVGVVNTLYSLGAPFHNVSQVLISITAGQICSQAFSICAEVDVGTKNSSLAQGLALVSTVTLAIKDDCPLQAITLAATKLGIDVSIAGINLGLDVLSKDVSTIQTLDAELGQGQGNDTANVAALIATVAKANATTGALAKAVALIDKNRKSIQTVAAQLPSKDADSADTLGEAAGLISVGEDAITAQLAQIQLSLASVLGVAGLFLTPSIEAQKGYNSRIDGTGVQNASFAGKLEITFPSFPPGAYWILAVDGTASDGGYAATLVYGCDQNLGGGGIQETLFILSRTPSLAAAAVTRLLAKAAALGVTTACSTPFIFTVQSPSCGNPPSDFPPYY